jgi:hypothetical protein
MIGSIIPLGRKGTSVDWVHYEKRCKKQLGQVPPMGERLTVEQLNQLGFKDAAREFSGRSRSRFQIYGD